MKGRISNKMGEIQINPDVIALYAGTIAVECFGIVGMAAVSMKDGLVKLLKRESLTHGINVDIKENKISIDNVDDFQNQMKTKNLIKIHYPYPSDEVKVVENYFGKSAKELFEAAKDKDGLVSVDGFVSSVDVSKDYIEPDRISVKLHNLTDIARRGEFSKLTYKEKECVIGLVSSIINELAKQGNVSKEELSKMPVDRLVIMLNKNIFISKQASMKI